MKKVFIIHGFNGTPNGGWKPWLMEEFERKNIYACSLPMPTPGKPVVKEWVCTIKNAIGKPNEEIYLVGHSLGVPAILRYLETLKNNQKIGGVFLVSGPLSLIQRKGYENVNKFLEKSFNFNKIKNVCKNFVVIHGDNDKSVPLSDAKKYTNKFSCNLIVIKNGGHLTGDEGHFKLPELSKAILKLIK